MDRVTWPEVVLAAVTAAQTCLLAYLAANGRRTRKAAESIAEKGEHEG